jgi:hypothetical protein
VIWLRCVLDMIVSPNLVSGRGFVMPNVMRSEKLMLTSLCTETALP